MALADNANFHSYTLFSEATKEHTDFGLLIWWIVFCFLVASEQKCLKKKTAKIAVCNMPFYIPEMKRL